MTATTRPPEETMPDTTETAEHRLTDLIDRWKIDTYPAADLMPSADAMPAFLADIDTVLRDLRRERSGHTGTMNERDRASDAADKLAYAIAPVEVIGEHGEDDPWAEALQVLSQHKAEHARLTEENAALRRALFVAPAAGAPARVFTGHDDDWGMPLFLNLADAKSYAELEFEARFPGYAAEYGDDEPIGWTERASRTELVGYPDMWDMSGGGANFVLCGVTVHPSLASALAEHPIEKSEPDDEPESQIPGQGDLPVGHTPSLVLPNEDFDGLAASLDEPAQPVPELVGLFSRHRVTPPSDAEAPVTAPTPRSFRIGDLVQITARAGEGDATPPGLRLNGKTGVVTELDDDTEYPIGITVEGWLGPVWCGPGEIQRLDRRCTACDGTGQRRDFNADGEFESVEVCGGCDGTGRVAAETESGAGR